MTLQTDQGLEFLNRSVQAVLKKYGIHHLSTHKADFAQSYNNTPNRSIGMVPSQVSAKKQVEVWQRLYGHDDRGVPKYRVLDRVRISKFKRLFAIGYMANWSEETFTRFIPQIRPCTDWSTISVKCWTEPSINRSCRRCRYPQMAHIKTREDHGQVSDAVRLLQGVLYSRGRPIEHAQEPVPRYPDETSGTDCLAATSGMATSSSALT